MLSRDRESLPVYANTGIGCWEADHFHAALQQRFGLLQVSGVKALGEPAVDRRQQRAGSGAWPWRCHSRPGSWRPAAPRFRLLAAGDVEGPLNQVSASACGMLPQQQDAPEATDFRFPAAVLPVLSIRVSASASAWRPSVEWPRWSQTSASRCTSVGRMPMPR